MSASFSGILWAILVKITAGRVVGWGAACAEIGAILAQAQRRPLFRPPCCGHSETFPGGNNQMTLPFQPHPQSSPEADAEVPEAIPDIVSYILERFHTVHRNELPGLIELAHQAGAENSRHADFPQGLAGWLETMAENLESHLQKEEQILFPMMAGRGHPMIAAPITVMRAEHADHEVNLDALARMTKDLRLPEDASASWHALYAGLTKFAADLNRHIYVENKILFPRFGA
jgi:iron-sulfur cluster repair di-iron protein